MAATEKVLGDLHKAVAMALTEQVAGLKVQELNAEGEPVEVLVRPSPAVLSAAIAFLKNNNITADAEDNAALRELGLALKARQKKRIPQERLDEAASLFAERFGDSPMQ
jgi:hypothetical protein